MKTYRCPTCHDRIVWALLPDGRNVKVNPQPTPFGDTLLVDVTVEGRRQRIAAQPLTDEQRAAYEARADRYRPSLHRIHAQTCRAATAAMAVAP